MAIEFKGTIVYGQRTIIETGAKDQGRWHSSRDKVTLELVPATDPVEDKIAYISKSGSGIVQKIMIGPEINLDLDCKARGIRWYDQNAPTPVTRYPWYPI